MITRFLVEKTIAQTLDERRVALWEKHGMREATADESGPEPAQEAAFWQDYLAALRDFTVVGPAYGSGAFLVAAFDELARRYRPAVNRLHDLGIEAGFDIFDEIVTKNLYGADLNAGSVEITRLALWLKTARREHRLQNLENTVKAGNSLIDDPAFAGRPFDWHAAFPEVFSRGGFDVVIGNPPYVRMEHLKAFKPYLETTYTVAAGRADLYAHFFEKGVGCSRTVDASAIFHPRSFSAPARAKTFARSLASGVGKCQSFVDTSLWASRRSSRWRVPTQNVLVEFVTIPIPDRESPNASMIRRLNSLQAGKCPQKQRALRLSVITRWVTQRRWVFRGVIPAKAGIHF